MPFEPVLPQRIEEDVDQSEDIQCTLTTIPDLSFAKELNAFAKRFV